MPDLYCPNCQSESVECTTKGFIVGGLNDNRAWCKCGWKGFVYNLVSKKQEEENHA